jgi:hypothetical protein
VNVTPGNEHASKHYYPRLWRFLDRLAPEQRLSLPAAGLPRIDAPPSRQIFLRFFSDARMENFLRGHGAAFTAWNGCSRVVLYDNLRSAGLERHGDAIRFHPTLLAFAAHYHFEPRPVAVGRGNGKECVA